MVGGGGLVELTYTVLDPEKATTFQSDTTHPPTLYRTGDSDNPVHIAALMKQGHNLRPGQTYFILYENPKAWSTRVTPCGSTRRPASWPTSRSSSP